MNRKASLKKAVVAIVIVFFFIILLASFLGFCVEGKTKIISWKDTHEYYGQYVTVEGKIVRTHNSEKVCFLNFHENWKRYFTAVIFAKDFHKFPENPEDYYYLKTVHVTGFVKEHQGKPEIILEELSQIKIIKQIEK